MADFNAHQRVPPVPRECIFVLNRLQRFLRVRTIWEKYNSLESTTYRVVYFCARANHSFHCGASGLLASRARAVGALPLGPSATNALSHERRQLGRRRRRRRGWPIVVVRHSDSVATCGRAIADV